MTNPLVRTFFIGRAVAQVIGEEFQKVIDNAFSEIEKSNAEQRQFLRRFSDRVIERADSEAAAVGENPADVGAIANPGTGKIASDLQATIDELRAEIARLRSELQNYRRSS